MSEPPPPGAEEEEEPLPPGAEAETEEPDVPGTEIAVATTAPSVPSAPVTGQDASTSQAFQPPTSGAIATSSVGGTGGQYAAYPGYDPNAAAYDYSAYWASYGYNPSTYYQGYYPGYEGYDQAAYAAYSAQQQAGEAAPPPTSNPPPPGVPDAASAEPPTPAVADQEEEVKGDAETPDQPPPSSKAEEEERQRAEEERKRAAAAAEEATRAAAEAAALQAQEAQRQAEEAAVRAQNLAAARAQAAQQVVMGPTPEVLERIQRELAQAQEAAERKKEEEKAAKAKADAEAEAAAKAAAAVNAGGLKKKKSATILLKGAKMAFNATGASVTRQVSLNKAFAESEQAENGSPAPPEPPLQKQKSNAGKLYLPEPLARANLPDFKPPPPQYNRSPSRSLSRSPSRSRSRARSGSRHRSYSFNPLRRSLSRGRSYSPTPPRKTPSRSQSRSRSRSASFSSRSRSPAPAAPEAQPRGRVVRGDRRQYRTPPAAHWEPEPEAEVKRAPSEHRERKEKKKHRPRRSSERLDDESAEEARREQKRRHKRQKQVQLDYMQEDAEDTEAAPAVHTRQPEAPRVASKAREAHADDSSSDSDRLPSPPRIGDLRRKYGMLDGQKSQRPLQEPDPQQPSGRSAAAATEASLGVPRRQRHVEEDGYAEERARDLDSEREQEAQHAERRERKKRRKEKKLKMEKRRREERAEFSTHRARDDYAERPRSGRRHRSRARSSYSRSRSRSSWPRSVSRSRSRSPAEPARADRLEPPVAPTAAAPPSKPLFPVKQAPLTSSRVLRLANMVGRSELLDDEEYADIVDDIRDEVERKYGRLARIAVPRPSAKGPDPPGVGLVFLCFESEQGAKEAQSALHGRKFGDNTVSSSYFDPAAFASKQFC